LGGTLEGDRGVTSVISPCTFLHGFAAFREELARRVLATDVVDPSGGRPRIDVTFMRLGAAAVGSMAGTPAEFIRRKHHVPHGSQDFNVHVIDTGPVVFAQAG
jgi:hypothetical protein